MVLMWSPFRIVSYDIGPFYKRNINIQLKYFLGKFGNSGESNSCSGWLVKGSKLQRLREKSRAVACMFPFFQTLANFGEWTKTKTRQNETYMLMLRISPGASVILTKNGFDVSKFVFWVCFLGAKSLSYIFNRIYNNMTYDLSTKRT
jgi:hypothetical protein